jgi:transposase
MERSMPKPFDLSKSLAVLDPDSTLIVVIEMSQSSWLVAARAPGLARDPLKKLPPDPEQLFKFSTGIFLPIIKIHARLKLLSIRIDAAQ